jgi:hypothetical protein
MKGRGRNERKANEKEKECKLDKNEKRKWFEGKTR